MKRKIENKKRLEKLKKLEEKLKNDYKKPNDNLISSGINSMNVNALHPFNENYNKQNLVLSNIVKDGGYSIITEEMAKEILEPQYFCEYIFHTMKK
jgi:hypothetical protein